MPTSPDAATEQQLPSAWPDLFRASMLGGALGDALGRDTEFDTRDNAGRDTVVLPVPAIITDDTQMAVVVARALAHPSSHNTASASRLRREFISWRSQGDLAHRAPGRTCLHATSRMRDGALWQDATEPDSKGSGAIMRAHPVAFIADHAHRARIAALQAAMTHGHPTSTIATGVWVEVVHEAARGLTPGEWLDHALHAITVPSLPRFDADYDLGVAEVLAALNAASGAVVTWDGVQDPCALTGEGWVAEDALATALLVAIRYADDPVGGIERAARTRGDSDTVASMVGALLGARHGQEAWPQEWVASVERPYLAAIESLVVPFSQ